MAPAFKTLGARPRRGPAHPSSTAGVGRRAIRRARRQRAPCWTPHSSGEAGDRPPAACAATPALPFRRWSTAIQISGLVLPYPVPAHIAEPSLTTEMNLASHKRTRTVEFLQGLVQSAGHTTAHLPLRRKLPAGVAPVVCSAATPPEPKPRWAPRQSLATGLPLRDASPRTTPLPAQNPLEAPDIIEGKFVELGDPVSEGVDIGV